MKRLAFLSPLILALGVSMYWNLEQAKESSAYSQQSYKNGLRDGEIFTRNQLTRAGIEQELIDD